MTAGNARATGSPTSANASAPKGGGGLDCQVPLSDDAKADACAIERLADYLAARSGATRVAVRELRRLRYGAVQVNWALDAVFEGGTLAGAQRLVLRADPATRHYVERTLLQYRLAGVDKDDATRARLRELQDKATLLGLTIDAELRVQPG